MTDRYAVYRETALKAGLDEKVVDDWIAGQRAEDEKLDRCECPKCASPLSKLVDGRQAGGSAIEGVWVRYRCTSHRCNYAIDRKEDVSGS